MTVIELPARGVTGTPGQPADIIGGPDALAERGLTGGHVVFEAATTRNSIDVASFDALDLPTGATIDEIRFVGEGYSVGRSSAAGDSFFWPGRTNAPMVYYPAIFIDYPADPYPFGGYNLSTFPESPTLGDSECAATISVSHLTALAPSVYLPAFAEGAGGVLTLTYLAIRVTYTGGVVPRLRNYPTDAGRNYPPDRLGRNTGRQP